MKNSLFFMISLFIGAILIFYFARTPAVKPFQKLTPVVTIQSSSDQFSVDTPPSESIMGSIASRSGILFWESRTATMPSELTSNVQIRQGEELITQDSGRAVLQFENMGTVEFSENTDISFIQTLPIDFVVNQKSGTAIYTVGGTTPLSIRIRNAIITKISGTIEVSMKDGDSTIVITTTSGTAQIGFNDLEYVSQVFTLREGQKYEYNSDERTAVNTNNK